MIVQNMKTINVIIVLMLLSGNVIAEENYFTFAPPPVTNFQFTDGEKYKSQRLSFNTVTINVGEQTISAQDINWTFRGGTGNGYGFIGQAHIGRFNDDKDLIQGIAFGYSLGVEMINSWGTIFSASFRHDRIGSEVENNQFGGVNRVFDSTVLGGSISVQHRFAFGTDKKIGVTPYVIYSTVKAELEEEGAGGIDPISSTTSQRTFGFDIDYKNISLSTIFQETDESSVTAFGLGYNF